MGLNFKEKEEEEEEVIRLHYLCKLLLDSMEHGTENG